MSISVLPHELIFQIFSYLDLKDLNTCRTVTAVWRNIVDHILFDPELIENKSKPVDFFIPLVTRINKEELNQKAPWSLCQPACYRRLYRSPAQLFADTDNCHAKGYYKIKLSFFNLTSKTHFPRLEPEYKRYTLNLTMQPDQIISYTFKEGNIEYQNPFIKRS